MGEQRAEEGLQTESAHLQSGCRVIKSGRERRKAEAEGAFDDDAPHQRALSSHEHTPTDRAAAPVVGSGTNTGA